MNAIQLHSHQHGKSIYFNSGDSRKTIKEQYIDSVKKKLDGLIKEANADKQKYQALLGDVLYIIENVQQSLNLCSTNEMNVALNSNFSKYHSLIGDLIALSTHNNIDRKKIKLSLQSLFCCCRTQSTDIYLALAQNFIDKSGVVYTNSIEELVQQYIFKELECDFKEEARPPLFIPYIAPTISSAKTQNNDSSMRLKNSTKSLSAENKHATHPQYESPVQKLYKPSRHSSSSSISPYFLTEQKSPNGGEQKPSANSNYFTPNTFPHREKSNGNTPLSATKILQHCPPLGPTQLFSSQTQRSYSTDDSSPSHTSTSSPRSNSQQTSPLSRSASSPSLVSSLLRDAAFSLDFVENPPLPKGELPDQFKILQIPSTLNLFIKNTYEYFEENFKGLAKKIADLLNDSDICLSNLQKEILYWLCHYNFLALIQKKFMGELFVAAFTDSNVKEKESSIIALHLNYKGEDIYIYEEEKFGSKRKRYTTSNTKPKILLISNVREVIMVRKNP